MRRQCLSQIKSGANKAGGRAVSTGKGKGNQERAVAFSAFFGAPFMSGSGKGRLVGQPRKSVQHRRLKSYSLQRRAVSK